MTTRAPRPLAPWLLILGLGFASLGLVGQAQTGFPATAPPPAAAGSAPASSDYQALDDSALIKVNFPNTPIMGIIPFYQQLTGKNMILDGSLQGETLRIIGVRPMSKKEALRFIDASLLLNGYAIIEKDPTTVMLIHHTGGKSPTAEGLPVFTAIKDLPEGDTTVHFVMPLQNISPEEATKAFTTVIKLHSYGAITAVNNTSNIIITENTATIRSIFNLAQVIDVPPAEIENEMIELKRSDAESIADIINEIFEEKEKSATAPTQIAGQAPNPAQAQPGQPIAAPSIPGIGSANSANTNPTAAKVKVIAYRRTNSLLVIARPVDIAYIRGLVAKLDNEASEANFLQRKLQYMSVTAFLAIARDALSRDTDIESDGNGGGTTGSSGSRTKKRSTSTPSTEARQASNNSGYNNQQNGFNNSGYGGGMGGGGNSSHSSLADPEDTGSPESVVVGKTLLIADPQSNSLIVSGSPEHVQIIDKLIQTMDIRPQQIYISTLIGQVNLGGQYDYGVDLLRGLDDFTLRHQGSGTTTTTPTTGTTTSPGTSGSTTTGTNPGSTGNGGTAGTIAAAVAGTPGLIDIPLSNLGGYDFNKFNLYGQMGNLGRYIHLLEGNKNFKVLSRPAIYATNNVKSTISSGQRIAVPVSSLYNGGGIGGNTASVSSSIDYRDVVLKLEVVPLINSDNEVTLRIAQINDNVVGTQIVGGNNVPTIGTQELVTTVTVKDGSTVVLGGLITEREQKSENGVIFLRRIPIIKHLFNRTETQKSREELLIFIQPKIIRSSDPLDKPNQVEAGRSKVLEQTLDFGTRRDQDEIRRALPAEQER